MRGLGIFNWRDMHLSGEIGFLEKVIKILDGSNAIVLDIGANSGEYTSLILNKSSDLRVFSFEPHPKTFKQLQTNVEGHQNRVKLFNTAIGDNIGETSFYDCEDEDGSPYASFYKSAIEEIRERKAVEYQVKINRLDSLLKEDEINRVGFIKVDTEGAEKDVLLGASQVLASDALKFIQIEFNEMNASSSTFLRELIDIVPPQFETFRLLPGGKLLPLKPYVIWQNEIFGFQNIAFIRKDMLVHFNL